MKKTFIALLILIFTFGSAYSQEDLSDLPVQLPDGWSTHDDGPAQRLRERNLIRATGNDGQQRTDSIVYGERPDSTKLKVPVVDFSKQIFSFAVDPRQQRVAFCFGVPTANGKWNPEGELMMFDIAQHETLWNQFIDLTDYQLSASLKALRTGTASVVKTNPLMLTPYGLLHYKNSTVSLLDTETGKQLWKKKAMSVLVDEKKGMMLAYSTPTSAKLQGIQLSTGKKLWENKISHSHNWGWNEKVVVGDSLIVVAADDLHFLNPVKGTALTHKAHTGIKNNGGVLAATLGIVALGVLSAATTGYYFVPTGMDANVTSHLASNIYCHEGNYYLADRDQLRCFDKNGYLKWATQLPNKTASCSQLHAVNGVLHMANFGFGLKSGNEMQPFGRPFLAAFDIKTGDELSLQYLSKKKDMIEGAVMTDDGIFLMTRDALAYQSTCDTTIVATAWNTTAYGYLTSMPTDTIYTYRLNDEVLTPLHPTDKHCIVMTNKGKLLVVDNSLNIIDDYQTDNVYHICYRYGNLDFVAAANGDNDYWIVEQTGKPVVHFTIPIRMVELIDDNLYVASETSFFCINLNELQ